MGHFEVGVVHHGGEGVASESIHTLQKVDVAIGWGEAVAVYERSDHVVADGLDYLLSCLPLVLQEIHPDNGAEFFNQHLPCYSKDKVPNLQITCSPPLLKK